MLIIGITGGTGAGKTSAMLALKAHDAQALDCDEIYHELLLNCAQMKAEIETHFSNAITDGEVDRKKLSKIVWSDPTALKQLNSITHKYVDKEITRRIDEFKKQNIKIIAIDAIALIESGQSKKCDIVVAVTAPKEKRMARIAKRDNLTPEQAKARIDAQQPESFYIENSDYVLENNCGTSAEFEEKCTEFFGKLFN